MHLPRPLAIAALLGVLSPLMPLQAGELETRLMDDLLAQIGDTSLTKEVHILTRLDRIYIQEGRAPDTGSITNLVLMKQPWWKTVLYTTRPDDAETATSIAIAACPGESEPFTFSLYPPRDATVRSIVVTPPASEQGVALPPGAIRAYRERHIFVAPQKDMRAFRPFALEPVSDNMPLLSNVTTRFWVDLAVPDDAVPGSYTGRVDITTEEVSFSFDYTLQVHPFRLLEPAPAEMTWGFWVPPPEDRDLLRRHLDLMAASGVRTFAFEGWDAHVSKKGKVGINTDELDRILDEATRAGLTGPFLINVGLGEFNGSGPEYSPEWERNYTKALKLFEQHMAKRRTPFLALVFDEPRETNIRPCNRNREQMLYYLKLIKSAAPSLRTMINPMSDEVTKEHPGGFYTLFAEQFDVIMPHFWARASNLIARARQPGGAELWSYNDGPNRLGWGLHSWANGLHGRMQYAWLLNGPKDHPYSPVQRGSFEYAGMHPGMQLWATDLEGTLRPTPRLLGVREGIDDYRYLYTLQKRLAERPGHPLRGEIEAWIEQVRSEVPPYAHAEDFVDETAAGDSDATFAFTAQLDEIRQQAASYIQQLFE